MLVTFNVWYGLKVGSISHGESSFRVHRIQRTAKKWSSFVDIEDVLII